MSDTAIKKHLNEQDVEKVKNDLIGEDFLDQLYLTSLGDNILNGEKQCPFKGSNYEVECK